MEPENSKLNGIKPDVSSNEPSSGGVAYQKTEDTVKERCLDIQPNEGVKPRLSVLKSFDPLYGNSPLKVDAERKNNSNLDQIINKLETQLAIDAGFETESPLTSINEGEKLLDDSDLEFVDAVNFNESSAKLIDYSIVVSSKSTSLLHEQNQSFSVNEEVNNIKQSDSCELQDQLVIESPGCNLSCVNLNTAFDASDEEAVETRRQLIIEDSESDLSKSKLEEGFLHDDSNLEYLDAHDILKENDIQKANEISNLNNYNKAVLSQSLLKSPRYLKPIVEDQLEEKINKDLVNEDCRVEKLSEVESLTQIGIENNRSIDVECSLNSSAISCGNKVPDISATLNSESEILDDSYLVTQVHNQEGEICSVESKASDSQGINFKENIEEDCSVENILEKETNLCRAFESDKPILHTNVPLSIDNLNDSVDIAASLKAYVNNSISSSSDQTEIKSASELIINEVCDINESKKLEDSEISQGDAIKIGVSLNKLENEFRKEPVFSEESESHLLTEEDIQVETSKEATGPSEEPKSVVIAEEKVDSVVSLHKSEVALIQETEVSSKREEIKAVSNQEAPLREESVEVGSHQEAADVSPNQEETNEVLKQESLLNEESVAVRLHQHAVQVSPKQEETKAVLNQESPLNEESAEVGSHQEVIQVSPKQEETKELLQQESPLNEESFEVGLHQGVVQVSPKQKETNKLLEEESPLEEESVEVGSHQEAQVSPKREETKEVLKQESPLKQEIVEVGLHQEVVQVSSKQEETKEVVKEEFPLKEVVVEVGSHQEAVQFFQKQEDTKVVLREAASNEERVAIGLQPEVVHISPKPEVFEVSSKEEVEVISKRVQLETSLEQDRIEKSLEQEQAEITSKQEITEILLKEEEARTQLKQEQAETTLLQRKTDTLLEEETETCLKQDQSLKGDKTDIIIKEKEAGTKQEQIKTTLNRERTEILSREEKAETSPKPDKSEILSKEEEAEVLIQKLAELTLKQDTVEVLSSHERDTIIHLEEDTVESKSEKIQLSPQQLETFPEQVEVPFKPKQVEASSKQEQVIVPLELEQVEEYLKQSPLETSSKQVEVSPKLEQAEVLSKQQEQQIDFKQQVIEETAEAHLNVQEKLVLKSPIKQDFGHSAVSSLLYPEKEVIPGLLLSKNCIEELNSQANSSIVKNLKISSNVNISGSGQSDVVDRSIDLEENITKTLPEQDVVSVLNQPSEVKLNNSFTLERATDCNAKAKSQNELINSLPLENNLVSNINQDSFGKGNTKSPLKKNHLDIELSFNHIETAKEGKRVDDVLNHNLEETKFNDEILKKLNYPGLSQSVDTTNCEGVFFVNSVLSKSIDNSIPTTLHDRGSNEIQRSSTPMKVSSIKDLNASRSSLGQRHLQRPYPVLEKDILLEKQFHLPPSQRQFRKVERADGTIEIVPVLERSFERQPTQRKHLRYSTDNIVLGGTYASEIYNFECNGNDTPVDTAPIRERKNETINRFFKSLTSKAQVDNKNLVESSRHNRHNQERCSRGDYLFEENLTIQNNNLVEDIKNNPEENNQLPKNMSDILEKLGLQQQEISDLKLQLNASQQAKATLELEIRQKEEVIIKTQAEALKKEQIYVHDIKALKEQLQEKSKLIDKDSTKELELELKKVKAREAEALSELNARNNDEMNFKKIMEEYEKTISQRLTDFERLKEEHETATKHLANLEFAFSDIHQKYERSKGIIEGFKANEETLRHNLGVSEQTIRHHEEKYDSLKAHAKAQIEKSNKEILHLRDKYEVEINKLHAVIKRLEIKCETLEGSLEQKTKECAALSALCDEVTGKRV